MGAGEDIDAVSLAVQWDLKLDGARLNRVWDDSSIETSEALFHPDLLRGIREGFHASLLSTRHDILP